MTKKEQAEFDAMRLERDSARALRWPEYDKPSSMSPDEIKAAGATYAEPLRGWFYNVHGSRVTQGCSNGYSHGTIGAKTTTQQCGRMFRSELEALRALRHDMTVKYAEDLAMVDRRIEKLI